MEGSAAPLDAILEGSAAPLKAVLEGLAEPLAEIFVMDSHSTWALADDSPDFLEEAWVPAVTNPGLPEACILLY